MLSNKKLEPIVTFYQKQENEHFTCFYYAILFWSTKNIRQSSTYYFIIEIPNKWDLQLIAMNYSSDAEFKNFVKIYKKCTSKPYSFFGKWYFSCIW